jgi:hypothetical protein
LIGFLPEMVRIMQDNKYINLEDKEKELLNNISASCPSGRSA